MATISVSLPTDGSTASVSQYNTPITTIVNAINGGLDNSNIATGAAIATSKIASDGGLSAAAAGSGFVVQIVTTNFSAVNTGTTTIPEDDTIPQITEGTEFMTQAITPKSLTNHLLIRIEAFVSLSNLNDAIGALFQDSTANALAAKDVTLSTSTGPGMLAITHDMAAGTTSSTTFRFRAGPAAAGTLTFNGFGGVRKFGGITLSNITITEYRP